LARIFTFRSVAFSVAQNHFLIMENVIMKRTHHAKRLIVNLYFLVISYKNRISYFTSLGECWGDYCAPESSVQNIGFIKGIGFSPETKCLICQAIVALANTLKGETFELARNKMKV
jgi:hypothetical protein